MKRKAFILLLCLVLVLPVTARAAVFQNVQYVVDQADMLTDQENIYLNNRAEAISETWGVDVLIAIVADMDGESAGSYAAFLNGSRSWWDSDDALLFLLAMEEREWYIATFGSAMSLFSDDTLDTLGYDTAAFLSSGAYADGFSAYLSDVEAVLLELPTGAAPGSYVPDHYAPAGKSLLEVLPLSLLIGLAAAAIVVLVMRSAMNTRRRQISASDYLNAGSFDLRLRHDIFLYSNVSKTRRQQSTGTGSTGVHRSSGGRSHGGRGGRF